MIDKMGIVLTRKFRLGYGTQKKDGKWVAAGFGGWLPGKIKKGIVTVWNNTACFIFGHDCLFDYADIPEVDDNDLVCCSCCKSWSTEVEKEKIKKANRKRGI